jgi:soluble lytic murein transglycosylase-like protein
MAIPAPADPTVVAALQAAAALYEMPYALLQAVAYHESRYNPAAQSSVGALGLMQILPATAAALGIDPLDPAQAANGAARMLKRLAAKYGDWAHALAAYNWGPGNVNSNLRPADWPQATQTYVTRILRDAGLPSPFGGLNAFVNAFLRPIPLPVLR